MATADYALNRKYEAGRSTPFGQSWNVFGAWIPGVYVAHKDTRHPDYRPTPSPTTDPYWICGKLEGSCGKLRARTEQEEPSEDALPTPLNVCVLQTVCRRKVKRLGGLKKAACVAGATRDMRETSQVGVQTPTWFAKGGSAELATGGEEVLHGMPYTPAEGDPAAAVALPAADASRRGEDEGAHARWNDKQVQNITFDADGHMGMSMEVSGRAWPAKHASAAGGAGGGSEECAAGGGGEECGGRALIPKMRPGPVWLTADDLQKIGAEVFDDVVGVYAEWGVSKEECVMDLVSAFQRWRKRHALVVASVTGKGPRQAVLTLKPSVGSFVRVTLDVFDEPVVLECVPTDQLLKTVKELLWILYNNHAPFNTTLVDYVPRTRHPGLFGLPHFQVNLTKPALDVYGKYYSATLNTKQLVETLVTAWGAAFTYLLKTA